jgi:hypothetical protein
MQTGQKAFRAPADRLQGSETIEESVGSGARTPRRAAKNKAPN